MNKKLHEQLKRAIKPIVLEILNEATFDFTPEELKIIKKFGYKPDFDPDGDINVQWDFKNKNDQIRFVMNKQGSSKRFQYSVYVRGNDWESDSASGTTKSGSEISELVKFLRWLEKEYEWKTMRAI